MYRYSARGLAGYISRAVYWLGNEAMPAAPPDESKGARFAMMKEIVRLHKADGTGMAFGHIGNRRCGKRALFHRSAELTEVEQRNGARFHDGLVAGKEARIGRALLSG